MSSNQKAAILTGGLGQLGQAVAGKPVQEGWRVALLDQAGGPSPLIGEKVRLLCGVDVASPESAGRAVADLAGQFRRIDALVNIAGTFRWEPIASSKIETFDLLHNVNFRTAIVASKAALPHLLNRPSSIVNIRAASATLSKAAVGISAYAASKAGIAKLNESMAKEFKDQNLRVNAVLPSMMDTPANRREMPDADFSRWLTPDDLADVIAFLVSDAARAITGALVPVTGRV